MGPFTGRTNALNTANGRQKQRINMTYHRARTPVSRERMHTAVAVINRPKVVRPRKAVSIAEIVVALAIPTRYPLKIPHNAQCTEKIKNVLSRRDSHQ